MKTASRPDNGLDADDQGYFRLGEGFTGYMDEVHVYNRGLSAPEAGLPYNGVVTALSPCFVTVFCLPCLVTMFCHGNHPTHPNSSHKKRSRSASKSGQLV